MNVQRIVILGISLIGLFQPRPVQGQNRLDEFDAEILSISTGGHHDEIRSVIFAADGGRLTAWTSGLDKLAMEWDVLPILAGARAAPQRTVRPPVWRGSAGAIYAAALSPPSTPPADRRLALAGYGVDANRSMILVYDVGPGQNSPPLVAAVTVPSLPGNRAAVVNALAFNADGTRLAAGRADGRADIFDVPKLSRDLATHRPIATHRHPAEVVSLAFVSGGRLATGTAKPEGVVRLWDPRAANQPLAESKPAQASSDPTVTQIAVGRSRNVIAFTRATNRYVQFLDGRSLRPTLTPFRTAAAGNIIAIDLAETPEGQTVVAVAAFAREAPAVQVQPPDLRCQIEVRASPEWKPALTPVNTDERVRGLALSADGRYLGYGGTGGQAISFVDLKSPRPAPASVSGQGRPVFDIRFQPGTLAFGVLTTKTEPAEGAEPVPGYDLNELRPKPLDWRALRPAPESLNNFQVTPGGPFDLRLSGGAAPVALTLDRSKQGRWWRYCFIPPGPGHPDPTLAVATDFGITIYRADTGQLTRFLAGHASRVLALAPSPDGKWLVTGSQDQTVRVWALAGVDRQAPLGAKFGRNPQGVVTVSGVDRFGHADLMGLRAGQVVHFALLRRDQAFGPVDTIRSTFRDPANAGSFEAFDLTRLADAADALPPNEQILIGINTPGKPQPATTKREHPALTLFRAEDQEWVIWMPEGFYDSSVEGDKRYVGWHLNRAKTAASVTDTDFLALENFQKKYRKPDVIRKLLATGDKAAALALNEPPVPPPATPTPPVKVAENDPAPPKVEAPREVREPAVEKKVAEAATPNQAPQKLEIVEPRTRTKLPTGDSLSASRKESIQVDPTATLQAEVKPSDKPVTVSTVPPLFPPVTLPPSKVATNIAFSPRGIGPQRVTFNQHFGDGSRRQQTLDFDGGYAEGSVPNARLEILAVGVTRAPGSKSPQFPSAPKDVAALQAFFRAQTVGKTGRPYSAKETHVDSLTGAKTGDILRALRDLKARLEKEGAPTEHDTVVVALESPMLPRTPDTGPAVIASEAQGDAPFPRGVETTQFTRAIGEIAALNVLTVLVLECVPPGPGNADVARAQADWVRDLVAAKVVVVMANADGTPSLPAPSRGPRAGSGLFASAVADVLSNRAKGLNLFPTWPKALTLGQFELPLKELVRTASQKKQDVKVIIPIEVNHPGRKFLRTDPPATE